MSQFNIYAAKAHLSLLVQKALLGEEVIIARDNKPMVKLVAINIPKTKRQLNFAKGVIKLAADFDKPLEDFGDYQ
ncbi:MAG: prevent-host-death protein [Legionellales bacterium RIFCSPHIGHO2_12_FULL_37_14]|nr:MAG: prevent-host-death protein [Legionellales bacterium RIFCSPHIGHO2_12_FULL_37_14]